MKLRLLKSFNILVVTFFFLLVGFSADVLAQQGSVESEKAIIATEELMPSDGNNFSYSPKGRRDPFKSLVQEKKKIAPKIKGRSEKVKGPLEKFELSEYRLIALMVVKGTPRAMVKAPDGKGYTVKVGEYIGINGGLVKNIETKIIDIDKNGMRVEKSPDRIVVEEVGIDSYTGQEVKENRYIVM